MYLKDKNGLVACPDPVNKAGKGVVFNSGMLLVLMVYY